MRPERRRGMNLVMVGQERRTTEAFLVLQPLREVEGNGDTLPPKQASACTLMMQLKCVLGRIRIEYNVFSLNTRVNK